MGSYGASSELSLRIRAMLLSLRPGEALELKARPHQQPLTISIPRCADVDKCMRYLSRAFGWCVLNAQQQQQQQQQQKPAVDKITVYVGKLCFTHVTGSPSQG